MKKYQSRFITLMKPLTINKCSFSTGNEKVRDIKKTPYDGILYNKHNDFVTEVTLNKPSKYNALDLKMIRDLLKKVRLWVPYNIDGFSSDSTETASSKPKVVIFTGNGKAFCSGGDIISLYNAKTTGENLRILTDFFRYEYLLDYSLTKLEPLQVCLWHGAVMGGGVGISINSPFRIATDSTVFAMPETKIGLFTDIGASYFLPRLFNNSMEVGIYYGLTGDRIKGKQLAMSGVATHYVKEENFNNLKNILISKVNSKTDKESLNKLISEHSDLTYSKDSFAIPHFEAIKYAFKADSLDAIFNRLNNLKNGTLTDVKDEEQIKSLATNEVKSWADNCITNLNKFSPLSLVVNLELLKRGQRLNSIEEAFNLETQLIAGFMEKSDFFEGVRALLVDKDNNPQWSSKSYKDLNVQETIKKYFERKETIDIDTKL